MSTRQFCLTSNRDLLSTSASQWGRSKYTIILEDILCFA